jgi:putative membrane protein
VKPENWLKREDVLNVVRGVLMGAADIIPGVSGGTVALIVGIYQRLVLAVSHLDARLLSLLWQRKWNEAAQYLDFRFLATLGVGVIGGAVALASLIHFLLDRYQTETFAVFFGMIAASSVLVARQIPKWSTRLICAGTIAACAAYVICGLVPSQIAPTPVNIFLCSMIAICAMLLPGISGSFLLLIFGLYHHITGTIKTFAGGGITLETLTTLSIFAAGCATGLILFSKVLKWLLSKHSKITMAVLCGFMIGSLRRVWPFKTEFPIDSEHVLLLNTIPQSFSVQVLLAAALAIGAAALVLLVERGSHSFSDSNTEQHNAQTGTASTEA